MRRTLKRQNIIPINGVTELGLSGLKIMVLSDLHIEPGATRFDRTRLQEIMITSGRYDVDMLIIAGDFLDSLETFYDHYARDMIEEFLIATSRRIPVVIGIGNHDVAKYNENREIAYQLEAFNDYKNFIYSLRVERGCPVFLLDNSSVNLPVMMKDGKNSAAGELVLSGLTLPPAYYGFSETSKPKRKFAQESRSILWKTLQNELPKLSSFTADFQPSSRIWKALLIHSPSHLDKLALEYIGSFGYELVISGHLHNGAVPFWLDAVSKRSERGILGANGSMFPNRSRNTEWNSGGKLLTLGATKMLPEGNRHLIFKFFCANFPPDIRFLHFS